MATPRTIALRWRHPAPAWIKESKRDSVVWVDVEQLDIAWRCTDQYVGLGGTGAAIAGRYKRFGEWLAHTEKAVMMPTIGLCDDGEVSFTDGRHRFAWLRDRGLKRIPAAVDKVSLESITARFGAGECDCFITIGGRAAAPDL